VVQEMLVSALHEALRKPTVVPTFAAATPTLGADRPGADVAFGAAEQAALFQEPVAPYVASRFGRVLGQVQDTFIVSTTEDEVFFLDQHVVHERVVFEQVRAQLAAGPLASQSLLFPETLELGPAARALLERWREPLERLGFGFDGFGGDAVVLRAVPTLLKGDEPKRLIEAAVEELAGPKVGEPALDRALAFVACRAAVKANTPLAPEEMERLVTDLGLTETPYFCPHGRPIVSRVSMQDIRRELKRTW
jgi:DNA mismatch repair protein MutL